MPDHDALLEIALRQRGHVTTAQAAACGFSRQLLNYHHHRGSLDRVGHGIYRLPAVPPRPDDACARFHLLAHDGWGRAVGVVSHASALHLHGLLDPPPDRVQLSLARGPSLRGLGGAQVFRRSIAFPGDRPAWASTAVGRRRGLCVGDIEDRAAYRLVTPLRAIRDVLVWGFFGLDLPDIVERGLARGAIDADGVLATADALLPLHRRRLRSALRRALARR